MEEKTCTKCGKKLRRDNVAGVCGDAKACRARVAAGADSSIYDVKAPSESREQVKAAAVDFGGRLQVEKHALPALERFRIVADALGEDADALLEAFAESWLAQLKERVASED